jgi:type VI secretion system protein VasJ
MSSIEKNEWVIQLCVPFTPEKTGIDPRHSEEFYQLKQEIDKVSGADYELIEKNCETILLKQSKDLRVVGYLLFAKLQRQGIAGASLALNLYAALVEKFGTQLFPEKSEVKASSINWLNDARLKQLIKNKLLNADKYAISEFIKQLQEVNMHLQQQLPDMPGILTSLLATLEAEQMASPLPNSNPHPSPPPSSTREGTGIPNTLSYVPELNKAPQCQSDSEFKELLQLQLDYLYQKNDWFLAVALARAARWNGLLAPAQQNNLTNVTLPHDSLRSNLAYQVGNGAPLEILQCCENILMAPGGIFYFDAQYYAQRAASDMGQIVLANYITSELRILLERAPELINLLFVDGTPFISSQHRSWLESLVTNRNTSGAKNTTKEHVDLSESVNQLRAKVAGKTLVEKINVINLLPKTDQRVHFQQDYALARFCSEEQRVELALPILEKLAQLVEQHNLKKWEPEYALAVWAELRSAWKQRQNFLTKDMQKQVEQRIEDLFSLICQTNLERAVNLK